LCGRTGSCRGARFQARRDRCVDPVPPMPVLSCLDSAWEAAGALLLGASGGVPSYADSRFTPRAREQRAMQQESIDHENKPTPTRGNTR
jgi:hypothetical protein